MDLQEREIERKKADVKRQLRERRVPQSQIGRAWGFAGQWFQDSAHFPSYRKQSSID